jgi:hypothetical protein
MAPLTTDKCNHWDRIVLSVPLSFRGAAKIAARRRHMTSPEYCRQMLLRALEADGVRLPREVAAYSHVPSFTAALPPRDLTS